jgi:hypothetical protein
LARLALGLAVVASSLALASAGGGAAARTPTPFAGRVGVSGHTVWLQPKAQYASLRRAREGGVDWIREDFSWSTIERSPGHFDWRVTDVLMRNAARLRMHVLALATYAPSWASGHAENDKFPPLDPNGYARFVRELALRYGKGGTFWRGNRKLAPVPLEAIELWNEPWHYGFWGPEPDPVAYTRLVRGAAEAIAQVHSEIDVLAVADVFQYRADTTSGPDWFAAMLAADPGLWRSSLVDGWTVHLYSETRDPKDSTTPQRWRFDRVLLTRSLARAAGADKPIWVTEFGWSTSSGRPFDVSEETQARYVHDALVRTVRQWRSFVARSFVFTWGNPQAADGYNLIRPDGSARPAWLTLKSLIATGR